MPDDLTTTIAAAIDSFNAATPVTVMETLTALEQVRHMLTEAFLRECKPTVPYRISHSMSAPQTHDLKTWPEFFEPIWQNEKHFELRKEDDRLFKPGDKLVLREWSKAAGYSGRYVEATITYVMSGPVFGLMQGWVCMSISPDEWKLAPKQEG